MYIVRDKEKKNILHTNPVELSENLDGKQVYTGFDPETMEILKTNLAHVPDHYHVDKNGFIIEKTFEEKILEGIIGFDELFRFEGVDGADSSNQEGGFDKLQFVLDNKLVTTEAQCLAIFKYLDAEFEHKVAQKYRPGYEAKLMKDYILWIEEGKPENDKRQEKYDQMTASINAIKAQYKEVMDAIKKIIVPLKKKKTGKPDEMEKAKKAELAKIEAIRKKVQQEQLKAQKLIAEQVLKAAMKKKKK